MGTAPFCASRRTAVQPPSRRIAPLGASSGGINKTIEPSAGMTSRGRVKAVWEDNVEVFTPLEQNQRGQICDAAGNSIVSVSIGVVVLKKYEVKAQIGKGSFSRVLRVENRETKELYALKMIEKNEIDGNRQETELNVLQRVKHPNIVSLYDVFLSNTKFYLVLELATGGDLFDRIQKKGYFQEERGKIVIRMVLSGLAYLHNLGITHRDLKLENLLYKSPGNNSKIMISDFGLAHVRASKTDENGMSTTCGTAEYLAPEMLEGEIYTQLIDMWAMGVITYVVLCGAMPFLDDSRARLYQKIKSGQYTFPDQVHAEVKVLV